MIYMEADVDLFFGCMGNLFSGFQEACADTESKTPRNFGTLDLPWAADSSSTTDQLLTGFFGCS